MNEMLRSPATPLIATALGAPQAPAMVTCLGIVDTPRSSIFCRYRRCVYERSRNFTSEKAV